MSALIQIKNRIEKIAKNQVRLIAVSKGQAVDKIQAAIEAGQRDFGENYAQELAEKASLLTKENLTWHFLGHLQKNKVNKVLQFITWLHSLDSFELAEAIHKKASKPLNCLLEINCAKEETKTGLTPTEAFELIDKLIPLTNIDLRGLMTMSPSSYFKELSLLLKTINERYLYPRPLTELSMGMSGDFEVAIEEGATMVRIGTAIFGTKQ